MQARTFHIYLAIILTRGVFILAMSAEHILAMNQYYKSFIGDLRNEGLIFAEYASVAMRLVVEFFPRFVFEDKPYQVVKERFKER